MTEGASLPHRSCFLLFPHERSRYGGSAVFYSHHASAGLFVGCFLPLVRTTMLSLTSDSQIGAILRVQAGAGSMGLVSDWDKEVTAHTLTNAYVSNFRPKSTLLLGYTTSRNSCYVRFFLSSRMCRSWPLIRWEEKSQTAFRSCIEWGKQRTQRYTRQQLNEGHTQTHFGGPKAFLIRRGVLGKAANSS